MASRFFVAGTDTGIGKTYISVGLLKAFNRLGHATLGIKPIASGCIRQDNKFLNEDALALQQASSVQLDYDYINPFAFEPAIAPHIAAARVNMPLTLENILHKTHYALNYPADISIVEGVGGWYVPLNQHETMADLVISLKLPVILVVGIRLGCLNHTLLTYQAIKGAGLMLAGWVANCPVPGSTETMEMVDTLKNWLNAPCLGVIDFQEKPEEKLDPAALMQR
ncbi:MAG: dethiobiotin synthase [Gammaproteobacteria bacterium]